MNEFKIGQKFRFTSKFLKWHREFFDYSGYEYPDGVRKNEYATWGWGKIFTITKINKKEKSTTIHFNNPVGEKELIVIGPTFKADILIIVNGKQLEFRETE